MEVGLGTVVTLLTVLTILGGVVTTYDSQQARESQAVALLQQEFLDFKGTTETQLAVIAAQTTTFPTTAEQISGINVHLHSIDTRLDGLAEREGVVERGEAATEAEVQGVIRASAVPVPGRR